MPDNFSLSPFPFSLEGRRPVFVVGHPRSGTTLVQLLITAHPVFSSAPETHFFTHVLEHAPGWLNRTLRAEELPKLFLWLAGKPGIKLDDETQAQIIKAAEPDGIAPAVMLDTIMRFYGAKQNKHDRWLEKTPRHVNHIPAILQLFPDARIINIVRDPRDVVSSNVRFQNLSRTEAQKERRRICIERSETWNTMVAFARQLQPTENRMMTIRYEDLVVDPVRHLSEMMSFVGVEGDASEAIESFSSHYNEVALEKEVHKQLCAAGEIVDRRGIWKKRMTPDEAQIVDTLCVDLMQAYDYPVEHELIPLKIGLEKLRYDLAAQAQRARIRLYQTSRRGAGKVLRTIGLRK